MIHPSYNEVNEVIKSYTPGDQPTVSSRYSVCIATAKRARQLIDGAEPMSTYKVDKPLSIAVQEIVEGKVKVLGDEEPEYTEYEYTDSENSEKAEEQ